MSTTERRIAVCTQGTRGDFQPFLALALHLRKSGYKVKIFADPGAIQAAAEFGIEGVAVSDELKDLLCTKMGLKAMISGDLIDLAAQDSDDDAEEDAEPEAAETAGAVEAEDVDWAGVFTKNMDEFDPCLVLWSSLIQHYAVAWCRSRNRPDMSVPLQPQTSPSNEFKPISFQRIPVDPDQPLISLWLLSAQVEASRYFNSMDIAESVAKEMGEKVVPEVAVQGCLDLGIATPEQTFDELFNIEESGLIKLCAFSPAFWAAPKEWPQGGIRPGKGGIEVVGRWEITKDVQSEMSGGGGAFFGNNQEAIEFFQAGEPPVYLGWGSMVVYSKDWMARLAVGALKYAGKRGIILGGWANISAGCLDGAENAEELKAYSAKNVLFLKSAPHEWLFPQCRAAVHHGGIGTTQASLGAGCPTIITPVFADQHDIANRIQNVLKVGKRTQLFSKIQIEELGEAIKSCCDDAEIQKNTTALAAKMAKENGCARAEEIIRKFLEGEYDTGNWEKRRQATIAAYKAKRLQFHKHKKEVVFSMWNAEVCKKYRDLAEYNGRTISLLSELGDLCKNGRLWCVKAASGALAKAGDSIKTAEVGRYAQWTIVEQLDLKKKKDTTRLQVKRKKGAGPDEGWVSITNKGHEVMSRVDDLGAVQMIMGQQLSSLFSNLMPRDKKKSSKNSTVDIWRKNFM